MTDAFWRKTVGITFRSLSVRNFRLFAAGRIASVTGTRMMVVAQDWLVLAARTDLLGAARAEELARAPGTARCGV